MAGVESFIFDKIEPNPLKDSVMLGAKAAKENANAVLIKNKDLGEWNDIHPLDKKTLGKRAAKAAIDDLKKNN